MFLRLSLLVCAKIIWMIQVWPKRFRRYRRNYWRGSRWMLLCQHCWCGIWIRLYCLHQDLENSILNFMFYKTKLPLTKKWIYLWCYKFTNDMTFVFVFINWSSFHNDLKGFKLLFFNFTFFTLAGFCLSFFNLSCQFSFWHQIFFHLHVLPYVLTSFFPRNSLLNQ